MKKVMCMGLAVATIILGVTVANADKVKGCESMKVAMAKQAKWCAEEAAEAQKITCSDVTFTEMSKLQFRCVDKLKNRSAPAPKAERPAMRGAVSRGNESP